MKCPQCGHSATYLAKADSGSDVLVCVWCGYMGMLIQVNYDLKALCPQEPPKPLREMEGK